MNPRKPLAKWQEAAQGTSCDLFAFARFAGLRKDDQAHVKAAFESLDAQVCYPFPSPRPDPSRVRSFFCATHLLRARRTTAAGASDCIFHFCSALAAVNSIVIKTPYRGLSPCRKNSSSWHFSPCRSRAASPLHRQPAARALVPVRAQCLALSQTTTSRKPRLSVACLVQLPLIRAFAANLTVAAAQPRQPTHPESHPGNLPGWLFPFAAAVCVRARAT